MTGPQGTARVHDPVGLFDRAWGALRPAERTSVVEWAEAHVVLGPRRASRPGPLRIREWTPYLVEPLEAFADPSCDELVIMKSTQVGGTLALLIMIGYAAAMDPGPLMYVMPNRDLAEEFCVERVQELFDDSPKLAELVRHVRRDWTKTHLDLGRMDLYMAWAGSPTALSSKPIRYAFKDEIDKYPTPKGEGSPRKLTRERLRTYWNSKDVEVSTPTDLASSDIAVSYAGTDQRHYHVPCPACGLYQPLRFDRIKVPDDERDPERIEGERLAWYACAGCDAAIGDRHKAEMLARGVWAPEGYTVGRTGTLEPKSPDVPERPRASRRRGYHINALYSPWLTFSEIIAEFFRSYRDYKALKNFTNSWLGEVWRGDVDEPDSDKLEASRDASEYRLITFEGCRDYTIPDPVKVIVGGVDVQERFFYFDIYGYGLHGERWLLDSGSVGDFERVNERIVRRVWRAAGGLSLPTAASGIDAGYKTFEVYEFARANADRVRALRGIPRFKTMQTWRLQKTDKHPEKGTPLKHSFRWYEIDTNTYKSEIAHAIEHGKLHLPIDVPADYLSHMNSEQRVVERDDYGASKTYWAPKYRGAENHHWDCTVYADATADMIGALNLQAIPVKKKKRRRGSKPGGFVNAGGDWTRR